MKIILKFLFVFKILYIRVLLQIFCKKSLRFIEVISLEWAKV